MRKSFQFAIIAGLFLVVLTACAAVSMLAINYFPFQRTIVQSEPALAETTALEPAAGPATTAVEAVLQPVNTTLAAAGLELQDSLIQVYRQANPSVVYIINGNGSGSGFVFDSAGHIVTNNHVIAGGTSFEVVFAAGERLRATLTGADADSDLAVIKVEALPTGVQPLPLAPEDNLQVGQFVIAIGNPFGEQGSMSFGIVSGLGRSLPSNRTVTNGSSYTLPQVIQTDAPINPGNSGGPLLNLAGEVVGVNAAIASSNGAGSGVGFSIPVRAVQLVAPRLIEAGGYDYPYMGASFDGEIDLEDESLYGLSQTQGIYVLEVSPGSPAAAAGLRAANLDTGRGGDLVIAY